MGNNRGKTGKKKAKTKSKESISIVETKNQDTKDDNFDKNNSKLISVSDVASIIAVLGVLFVIVSKFVINTDKKFWGGIVELSSMEGSLDLAVLTIFMMFFFSFFVLIVYATKECLKTVQREKIKIARRINWKFLIFIVLMFAIYIKWGKLIGEFIEKIIQTNQKSVVVISGIIFYLAMITPFLISENKFEELAHKLAVTFVSVTIFALYFYMYIISKSDITMYNICLLNESSPIYKVNRYKDVIVYNGKAVPFSYFTGAENKTISCDEYNNLHKITVELKNELDK